MVMYCGQARVKAGREPAMVAGGTPRRFCRLMCGGEREGHSLFSPRHARQVAEGDRKKLGRAGRVVVGEPVEGRGTPDPPESSERRR